MERDPDRTQIFRDPGERRTSAGKAAGFVVAGAHAVECHLCLRDAASSQHFRNLLCQKIAVRHDTCIVLSAGQPGQRDQFPGKVLDNVGRKQRLAAKPCDVQPPRAGYAHHARSETDYLALRFFAHSPCPVRLETVGTVKIAGHRRADGQVDRIAGRALRPSQGLQRRFLIKMNDQAALRKAFQDRVVLIKLRQLA